MKYRTRSIFAALLFMLLSCFVIRAQERTFQFEPSETLVYEGEFTRSLLRGIDVAALQFSASRLPAPPVDQIAGPTQPFLLFTAEANSKGIVSKLFGLTFHQRVESIVEGATFNVMSTKKVDEQGKRKRTSEAVFDRASNKVTYTEVDPNDPTRTPRVVTSPVTGTVQDIASAFYYMRTLKLEPGQNFEISISDTGQVYRIPVKVIKREQLKTVIGKVQTVLVEPELFGEGRLIRGNGQITIWFTDDARHIPVRAKMNTSLGRVDIKLKSMTNNK
ncbi:MAG: DUF3108 domain-containing protein [Acidobacteria bacterium]|nr:DUF3108 domain-containing protein [Acidobacteriota bacterium]